MKSEKGKIVHSNFQKVWLIEMFYELKKYNYQKFVKYIPKNQLNELT